MSSWLGTGSIEISVEFYIDIKKKCKKKLIFVFSTLTPFFAVLSMKMTSWRLGTGSIGISVQFYTDYKKKNLKKFHFSKIAIYSTWAISEASCAHHGLGSKHRFFEFWPWRCRLHELGPVPLESALNFTLITKKKFEKKTLLKNRPIL